MIAVDRGLRHVRGMWSVLLVLVPAGVRDLRDLVGSRRRATG
jgi:hypothetical protein